MLLLTFNRVSSSAFAQGSLTPPGAPTPTMKTLDQIEARTPITTVPFTITRPGSYYLTTNFNMTTPADAIDINTNGVTLDLNGFTLSSTSATAGGTAISLAAPGGNFDVTILNGHIRSGVTNDGTNFSGPGFVNGIYLVSFSLQNIRVTGVSVSGCANAGIYVSVGNSSIVDSCTVQNCKTYGIVGSSVSHSSANQCGFLGIDGYMLSDCNASVIGNGTAINANYIAIDCFGTCGAGGTGVSSDIANSCYSSSGDAQILHAYNMP